VMENEVDRIHYGFSSFHDPQHFRYESSNLYENELPDYYVKIDQKIDEWLKKIGEDTIGLIVSDNGAKCMDGGIYVNEWLWRNGYLVLNKDHEPGKITPINELDVDWSKKAAWGDGGYYGRIYFHVKRREPQGLITETEYERARDELAEKLAAIPDQKGRDIWTRVFKPQETYREVNCVAPDFLVYFGNLLWRSAGSVGYGSYLRLENETWPDDCNHAQNWMVILYDPHNPGNFRQMRNAQLMNVAPTRLEYSRFLYLQTCKGNLYTS
jgi:predicted AlkP superfamily phosphohydrolase/phosphomutase